MAKQLTITANDKQYTLEFTRATVRQMEAQGIVAEEIDKKPMTVLPALFAGAFLAHHRGMKQGDIDAIYAALPDKAGLIGCLAEMYTEPISALLEDPVEPGNAGWTPNW